MNHAPENFIQKRIDDDIANERASAIVTRFPPEPNGYLHLGHVTAIVLNYTLARHYQGCFHLRFDDTNPLKEDDVYVNAIQEDIRWLEMPWDKLCFASDYFEQLYTWAQQLIRQGLAYVDQQSSEQIKDNRGTLTVPGTPSPYRDRSPEESLELFTKMRQGDFPEGSCVLRAKIDMASGNINLRDPVMYRIMHVPHHRTGDTWCIYPTYDWAHGPSDAIENISHSLCTIEFSHHNPLYEWFLDAIGISKPRTYQTEFAATNITYTLFSKRNLKRLVDEQHVSGWDDPRIPTVAGMRRRGFTAKGIRDAIQDIGVSRHESVVQLERLEYFIRHDLNAIAQRVMAVLDPLKVIITNYPEGQTETLEAINNHEDPSAGTRLIPFSHELYIERDDFLEDPPKKFFRLAPGREVRLMHAYYLTCTEVIKDANGNITALHCRYDPETRGGQSADGRKVKGTLHWVSADHALTTEVRLYDRLFTAENPRKAPEGKDFTANLNPASLTAIQEAKIEPSVKAFPTKTHYQFLRKGYFIQDASSSPEHLIFNRTITLKDSWAKLNRHNN